MSKFVKALGAVAVALSFNAQADAVLDSFTDTQIVSTDTAGAWASNQVSDSVGTIFGGYREIGVFKVDPPGTNANRTVAADVNQPGTEGLYTFSTSSATQGIGKIRYDGAAETGMDNGPDTSQNLGSLLDLGVGLKFTYDTDIAFSVEFEIFDINGDSVYGAFLTTANPITTATTINDFFSETLAWTDLDPNAYNPLLSLIDWNNISAIDVTLNGLTSAVRIDLSVAAVNSIPEPASILIAGLALLGAGVASKRRKA